MPNLMYVLKEVRNGIIRNVELSNSSSIETFLWNMTQEAMTIQWAAHRGPDDTKIIKIYHRYMPVTEVADPVHFSSEPDTADQNLNT